MRRVGLHHDPAQQAHATGSHPEHPGRIEAILMHLAETGLAEALLPVAERVASDADLALVHDPALIERLVALAAGGGGWVDADTVVLPGSVEAARRAVGGALAAVDAVLAGDLDAALCLDRPPGHHATPSRAMGFCLFNQVAIAARYAQQRHGLSRVAIVDWDVHHGNGTQDAFYRDASVLYVSTHQYPFYPGTGHWRETGDGAGGGATVNVPLPAGSGDAEYLAAFDRVALSAVRRFRPELILVSAGFDAHRADPLAQMAVSEVGYRALATRLAEVAADVCDGRLALILEGGYDLDALARSVAECVRVLLGSTEPAAIDTTAIRSDVDRLLGVAAATHRLGE